MSPTCEALTQQGPHQPSSGVCCQPLPMSDLTNSSSLAVEAPWQASAGICSSAAVQQQIDAAQQCSQMPPSSSTAAPICQQQQALSVLQACDTSPLAGNTAVTAEAVAPGSTAWAAATELIRLQGQEPTIPLVTLVAARLLAQQRQQQQQQQQHQHDAAGSSKPLTRFCKRSTLFIAKPSAGRSNVNATAAGGFSRALEHSGLLGRSGCQQQQNGKQHYGKTKGRTTCQVDGCLMDLPSGKDTYTGRYRVCSKHMMEPAVVLYADAPEHLFRFCNQCFKFEPLAAFDGMKRGCRASLARRRERQRAKTAKARGQPLQASERQEQCGQYDVGQHDFGLGQYEQQPQQQCMLQLQQPHHVLQMQQQCMLDQQQHAAYDAADGSTEALTAAETEPVNNIGRMQSLQLHDNSISAGTVLGDVPFHDFGRELMSLTTMAEADLVNSLLDELGNDTTAGPFQTAALPAADAMPSQQQQQSLPTAFPGLAVPAVTPMSFQRHECGDAAAAVGNLANAAAAAGMPPGSLQMATPAQQQQQQHWAQQQQQMCWGVVGNSNPVLNLWQTSSAAVIPTPCQHSQQQQLNMGAVQQQQQQQHGLLRTLHQHPQQAAVGLQQQQQQLLPSVVHGSSFGAEAVAAGRVAAAAACFPAQLLQAETPSVAPAPAAAAASPPSVFNNPAVSSSGSEGSSSNDSDLQAGDQQRQQGATGSSAESCHCGSSSSGAASAAPQKTKKAKHSQTGEHYSRVQQVHKMPSFGGSTTIPPVDARGVVTVTVSRERNSQATDEDQVMTDAQPPAAAAAAPAVPVGGSQPDLHAIWQQLLQRQPSMAAAAALTARTNSPDPLALFRTQTQDMLALDDIFNQRDSQRASSAPPGPGSNSGENLGPTQTGDLVPSGPRSDRLAGNGMPGSAASKNASTLPNPLLLATAAFGSGVYDAMLEELSAWYTSSNSADQYQAAAAAAAAAAPPPCQQLLQPGNNNTDNNTAAATRAAQPQQQQQQDGLVAPLGWTEQMLQHAPLSGSVDTAAASAAPEPAATAAVAHAPFGGGLLLAPGPTVRVQQQLPHLRCESNTRPATSDDGQQQQHGMPSCRSEQVSTAWQQQQRGMCVVPLSAECTWNAPGASLSETAAAAVAAATAAAAKNADLEGKLAEVQEQVRQMQQVIMSLKAQQGPMHHAC